MRFNLIFALTISFFVRSYPNDQMYSHLKLNLNAEKFNNSNEILLAFKACVNLSEVNRLYSNLLFDCKRFNSQQLIKIQYAKTLNSFGNQSKAIMMMQEVSRKLEKSSSIVQIEHYIVLGAIAVSSENPILARNYFQKALKILEIDDNVNARVKCYISLGMAFTAENKLDSAQYYYVKASELDNGGAGLNSLYLKLNMAWTASKLGELESSKSNFREALNLFETVNDVFAEMRTLGNLGDIYFEQDSTKIAKIYYSKGLEMANKYGFKLDVFRFKRAMGLTFAKESNFKDAFNYLHHSDSIREAFGHEKIISETQRIEKEYLKKIENERNEARKRILKETKKVNTLLIIATLLVITLLVFVSIYYIKIRNKNRLLLQKLLEIDRKKEKDVSVVHSNNSIRIMVTELENLIYEKELYKNESLTLEKLAKKLKTNRTYLSECINSHYNLNFNRWLNEIRINESRKLLQAVKNDKYSIEGIANMVGFNSISTFNANFKAITGITPSYYRKNCLKH